jgi:2-octaprenyl-6-methoxyphenol hydroxylase
MTPDYDVLIVGGGLVGASLACALGGRGLRVAVVEAVPFRSEQQPSYDDRTLALAQGTSRIFAAMGLWEELRGGVTPIHVIHSSDRGRFGFTRLRREEEGVEALGYVAPARLLGAVLGPRLESLPGVELICPARLRHFQVDGQGVEVSLDLDGETRVLRGRLLVAADGSQSRVRESLDIATTQWTYGQTALIANISPQLPHKHVAYERFTDSGPLALLPMSEGRCSLVWTLRDEQVDEVLQLPDARFLARLQERFGHRLGRFERVGTRHAYPLSLVRARESVRPRVALIGNALHTLHPIAGQGFNLGLRDVAVLAELLVDAHAAGQDPGDLALLQRYADWRGTDHQRVIAFTDGLVRLFSSPLASVGCLRDAGMVALDLLPPAKRLFGRLTMGRSGRLPRLARGLPL